MAEDIKNNGVFVPTYFGYQYKDGKLFSFSSTGVLVVKVRKDGPVAWCKNEGESSFSFTLIPEYLGLPSVRCLVNGNPNPEELEWPYSCVRDFLKDNIPFEMLTQMASYNNMAWTICSLLMRVPSSMELVKSNPGISAIIAFNNRIIGRCAQPWRRARSLVSKKRTEIAKLAGFEPTKSTVKILGKLSPEYIDVDTIFFLRKMMRDKDPEVMELLQYIPVITRDVLYVLNNQALRRMLNINLISSITRENPYSMASKHINLIREANDVINLCDMTASRYPRNLKSRSQLKKVHDELCGHIYDIDFTSRNRIKIINKTYPEQPLPDYEGRHFKISYIPDTYELHDWGLKQHNCLPTYDESAASGRNFFYKITSPEEASLRLMRKSGGGFTIGELKGTCNVTVKPETAQCIKVWIENGGKIDDSYNPPPFSGVERDSLSFQYLDLFDAVGELQVDKKISPYNAELDSTYIFYEMSVPERGYFALKKINTQWENVLAVNSEGKDFKDTTIELLEEFLWEKAPVGVFRQMKFRFSETEKIFSQEDLETTDSRR